MDDDSKAWCFGFGSTDQLPAISDPNKTLQRRGKMLENTKRYNSKKRQGLSGNQIDPDFLGNPFLCLVLEHQKSPMCSNIPNIFHIFPYLSLLFRLHCTGIASLPPWTRFFGRRVPQWIFEPPQKDWKIPTGYGMKYWLSGWWYTYPSEKYESGWWHSQFMDSHKIHVPNHQPVI